MAGESDLARRTAAKRFNECLALAAGTWNTLVLAILIAAIVAPVPETKQPASALTALNGVIAAWCFVLHLMGYLIVRQSKAE